MERLNAIVETFFSALRDVRGSGGGTREASYYPALSALLTGLGRTLKPQVVCVIQMQNRGAGLPDGGLFTKDQLKRIDLSDPAPLFGQLPARGVIEIKSPSQDLNPILESDQVAGYWKRYGLVLVTNLRQFALLGRSPSGAPTVMERFSLADTEAAFWDSVEHPRKSADSLGAPLAEYLLRVLLHNAPLGRPQDVAAILAAYARDALLRVDRAGVDALDGVRRALEDALGLRFTDERGEHFFRSTLVQTLFYGVFSAWVLWARHSRGEPRTFRQAVREPGVAYHAGGAVFDWRVAQYHLRVPMIRALFVQVADPAQLGALGLVEVLDWTAAALNRVDRAAFFESFDEGRAVQYFYEPFLEAFDPALRKDLGVWYTPEEIVRYQVERVDAVLRSELDIPDGLADPRVVVLDPCFGTGAYLRAVLARIAATLREKGGDALVAHDLKKAAIERVFGFEILPAPFVIGHLQIALLLEHLGAPLSDARAERPGLFLSNALTGWEPPREKPKQIAFPGFDEERDAAGRVKQEKPILVILGNPPYNAFAGVSPEEEQGLVEPYKKGLNTDWGIRKFNLDDLYVRFFRLAEKRIAEKGGRGIVSFISNHSWVSDPSFVVLRRHLLDSFDKFWIENMHGNRKISEYAPDGRTSETVFAIPGFSPGIQQGVAISLWVKRGQKQDEPVVMFRDDLNAAKAVQRRADLLSSLDAKDFNAQYERVQPRKETRWSFRPSDASDVYLAWPKLTDLCAEPPSNGLMEKRGGALIDDDRAALEARMKRYFDKSASFDSLKAEGHPLTRDAARYAAKAAHFKLLAAESYNATRLRRYAKRSMDHGWCYFTPIRPIWNEPRPSFWAQCWDGNAFLLSRPTGVASPEGFPMYFTRGLGENDLLRGHAYYFSLRIRVKSDDHPLPGLPNDSIKANLSPAARAYLGSLGFQGLDDDAEGASNLWMHALAIGYSPAYLTENADGLRGDWPRIPLPASREVFAASADLGRRVAALLDVETPVAGVTTGSIPPELRGVAVFVRADGKPADPDDGDLDLTAGWGHGGKGGVTMPGRGKVRESGDGIRKAELGSPEGVKTGAIDVWLNERTCWANVPREVWDFTIGGYQVIKKWLSYREKPILGRGLTPDEVRHVTDMARRLAALAALRPALDANYRAAAAKILDADSHRAEEDQ